MAVNTTPIFPVGPNIGTPVIIPWNNAVGKTDGVSAGSGADQMYKVFAAGPNGAFVERIKFMTVYTGAANTALKILRVFMSTTAGQTVTAQTNTSMLGEIYCLITPAASLTVATPVQELLLNLSLPPNNNILVCQSIAEASGSLPQYQAWVENAGQY